MLVFVSEKTVNILKHYSSLVIFLFSAVFLSIPDGSSVGAILLLLGSCTLFFLKIKGFSLIRDDWAFIAILCTYVLGMVLLNIIHKLPLNSYDLLARYLLAIPAYLLLISIKPDIRFFWWGLCVGTFSSGVLAIYQLLCFDISVFGGRPPGFLNPIQFGDIAVLMVGLLMAGVLFDPWVKSRLNVVVIFLVCAGFGLIASAISLSRGGWVAVPILGLVYFWAATAAFKRKIAIAFFMLVVFVVVILFFLPNSNFIKIRVFETISEFHDLYYGTLDNEKMYTINTRVLMWKNAIEAFQEKPFLGWGSINLVKEHYAIVWQKITLEAEYNHFHNEYLDLLVKKGISGIALFMFILVALLVYFVRFVLKNKNNQTAYSIGLSGVALVVSVLVFGLTQCFLAHNSGVMAFVFYLIIIRAYCRNIISADG